MLFSSITYLFYFFAAFLLLYFAVPFKLKNAVLLIFSLIFYAWGGVKYALLMVTAILVGYVFGILIEKFRDKKRVSLAFTWLAAAIILAFMLYFKYTNFFIDNINKLTGANIGFLDITLPVGISFYTFQTISYVIDVYRGVPAQKNIIDLAAYVSMFPQLIAGPIVRYVDIAKELKHRTHSIDKAAEGIRRFVIGLGKKILIADRLSELCDMLNCKKDTMFAGNLIMSEYMPDVMDEMARRRFVDVRNAGANAVVTASCSENAIMSRVCPDDIEVIAIEELF